MSAGSLQQQDETHHCGRHGRRTCAGLTVHRQKLRLELVVEDLVPVKPQKLEQLSGPIQPLEDSLLTPCGFCWRFPKLADFLPLISDEAIEELDQTYLIGLRVPVDGELILGPLPVVGIAARFVMLGYRYGWVSPRADWCKWHVAPAGRFYLDHVAQISGASIDDLVYLMTTLIRCERFCEGSLTDAFRQGHITAICRRAAVMADELRRGVRHRATRFDDISRWTRIGMGD